MISIIVYSILWTLFVVFLLWTLYDYRQFLSDFVKALILVLAILFVVPSLQNKLPGSVHNKDCQCWLCKPPEPPKQTAPSNIGILIPKSYPVNSRKHVNYANSYAQKMFRGER